MKFVAQCIYNIFIIHVLRKVMPVGELTKILCFPLNRMQLIYRKSFPSKAWNITPSRLAIANIAGDFVLSYLMFVYLVMVVYMFVNFSSQSKQHLSITLFWIMECTWPISSNLPILLNGEQCRNITATQRNYWFRIRSTTHQLLRHCALWWGLSSNSIPLYQIFDHIY